ncbi:EAL and HDOD domain-containing protein [Fictibacillus barbaricus]|uniref:EAL and modified HD-GYP domain-containing signal transduction protein n=1 Tax=Fictibacillus barbaricus TaxID=182136 RepID=A0ABU1U0T8_9BACL|nr:HDOD domain-containing protein [Fictibacillus barbaricus]MDR7073006.1 EAL and modified HD-GYP domain-containing signal transduction protein [Fictibacillus barbaricus]
MDIFIGRQPILDKNENVVAYELLYRNSSTNRYEGSDHDNATLDVLVNSFTGIGIREVGEKKKCFINFTENLLLSRVPTYISPDHIVVEILETVNLTQEIITVCKELKSKGYIIALDDVISNRDLSSLIPFIDIIKIDYLVMEKNDIKEMIKKYKGEVHFLAEKIENRKEYEEAKEMGFDYFQGYFFSKPVILTGKDIAPVPTNYFQLLNVLNGKEPDIEHISSLIQQDLSISFKLLKLLNSGAFIMKNKVTSIKQAVVLLGLNEIKKVVTILLMTSLKRTDNQTQLVQMSLTRAHFFEQIASMLQIDKNSLYMFGMFSLIDTILNKDMNDIVEDLPITSELSDALLGKNDKYNQALLLVETIEYGRWNETAKLCTELQLPETELFLQFQKSTLSTDKYFQIGEKSLTGA